MHFYCDGCFAQFDREGKLIQHLQKSERRQCAAAWQAMLAKMRPVKGRKSPSRHRPVPAAEVQQSTPFRGDFFGDDYVDEDFPFPEPIQNGGLPHVDEVSDDSSSSDGEDDMPADFEKEVQNTAPESLHHPLQHVPHEEDVEMDVEMDDDVTPANAPGGISIEAHRTLCSPPVFITKFTKGKAGAPVSSSDGGGGDGYTQYASQVGAGDSNVWAPFSSRMEWEIARWAKLRGPGSTAFSELLEIDGVYHSRIHRNSTK